MHIRDLVSKANIFYPLRIEEVKTLNASGLIDMPLCLGKKINSAMSGVWDRDLVIDLKASQDWGTGTLVNLMEEH